MSYLLDTSTFLWWIDEYGRLPSNVLNTLVDPENRLYLSIASVWEMQIKSQIGKLKLPGTLPDIIERQINENNLLMLRIELAHVFALARLPDAHKDPFDRIIIAQAIIEDLTLISSDSRFASYPVRRLWT
jgi:PIN domain nuclease of toxin-antitoxin system